MAYYEKIDQPPHIDGGKEGVYFSPMSKKWVVRMSGVGYQMTSVAQYATKKEALERLIKEQSKRNDR